MPRYFSDDESSIEAIFEREGDALKRAGFDYTNLSHVPEDVPDSMGDETTEQYIVRRAHEIHAEGAWANDLAISPGKRIARSAWLHGLIPDNAANRSLLE